MKVFVPTISRDMIQCRSGGCCHNGIILMHEYFFIPAKGHASPYINHFLQPDSIISDYTNPQTLNRYSYVGNNPINFNDPSGHCAHPIALAVCVVLIVGTVILVGIIVAELASPAGSEMWQDHTIESVPSKPTPAGWDGLNYSTITPTPTNGPTAPTCDFLGQAHCNTATPTPTNDPSYPTCKSVIELHCNPATPSPTNTATSTATNTATSSAPTQTDSNSGSNNGSGSGSSNGGGSSSGGHGPKHFAISI